MSDARIAISRVLLSGVFIVLGFHELVDVGTVTSNPGATRFMELLGAGGAAPLWFGYFIAALEFLAGLAVLVGFKTRGAAWTLVIFLLLTTGFVHAFWLLEGPARAATQSHFLKNLAMAGGFLLLTMTGGGRYSLDHRGANSRPAWVELSLLRRLSVPPGLAHIGDVLQMHAAMFPDKVGARDLERALTFRLWYARACRLANALTGLGLTKGDRVCVLAYNCLEWWRSTLQRRSPG